MGQKVPGPPWSYSPTLNNCPLPIISKKLSPPQKIYHFKILHPRAPPTISGVHILMNHQNQHHYTHSQYQCVPVVFFVSCVCYDSGNP